MTPVTPPVTSMVLDPSISPIEVLIFKHTEKEMDKTIRLLLKVKKDLGKYKPGQEVIAICDEDGVPYSPELRRYLTDAKIDGCIEVITDSREKQSPKPSRKSKAEQKPIQQKENDK